MTFEDIRKYCLTFEKVSEKPHFNRTAFKSKRIFLTHIPETQQMNLKLSPADQDLFTLPNKALIYPVPNKWGLQGWTTIEFDRLEEDVLIQLLKAAYRASL